MTIAATSDAVTHTELVERLKALEAEVALLRKRVEDSELDASLARAMAEADQGGGTPAREVFARLHAKHNLPTT